MFICRVFYFLFSFVLITLLTVAPASASLSIWGFEDPVVEKKMEQVRPENAPSAWGEAISGPALEEGGQTPEPSVFEAESEAPLLKEESSQEPTPTEIEEVILSHETPEMTDEALSDLITEGEENTAATHSALNEQAFEVTYDMPVAPDNEHVKKYISLFQNRLRPNFEKWLARSGRYMDMIQKTLRENNLPEDLVYLALIESGFSPKAHSKSKASGVWQFMKGTGKRYGLRVDRWIDERRDPIKSTRAAAKYLTELYDMFGSWPLALAGYNAGEGRVYRTIVRVRTRDFWTLRKSRHLRAETRNYVPKFMAATILAKDPERYGFSIEYEDPWEFDEVEIQHATYLSAIAKYAGISVKELKKYNPELKQNITPPRAPGYKIKLPPGRKEAFLAAYSPDKEEKIFVGRTFKHRVRRGETISSIAAQYGVSTRMLLKTNNLSSRSIIRIGQKILIQESPTVAGDRHRIRRGESVSTIASKYRVSIRRLLEANQLSRRSVIRAGDTLIIPSSSSRRRASAKAGGSPKRHQIRTGESISTIAQKYAVRMRDLLKANRLTKNSVIRAGHTLIIP
ncbi:MAG: LysM peptidoglycan-binding domain-containing protein [Nitrospiria bacterium]